MHRLHSLTLALSALALLLPASTWAASRRQSVEQLTNASEKIVLGTVLSRSSHWTSDSLIYTDVVVSSDVAIKGDAESAIVVQVPGGIVGDIQMTVSDAPEFTEGEHVLIFLDRKNGHFEVAGRDSGKYSLSSGAGAAAVDTVLRIIESSAGRGLSGKRSLASDYVTASARSTATAAATDTSSCYGASGVKWPTGSAAYKIGASIPADWPASIDAATATWNNAGAAFTFTNNSGSVNELSYLDLVAKYGSSYSNTYAVTTTWSNTSTNRITKANIEINTGFQWSTSGEANRADVQNILTHEFGHWLRLDDIYSPSACSDVTMWGYAALGETKKRTLEQPDIDGFLSLYGPRSGSGGGGTSLNAPTLSSPGNGATGVASSAVLTWSAVSGATGYDVYIGTANSPALAGTVTGTTYQASSLAAGTTYHWRVVAKNASTSASSATWSFTTAPNSTPGTLATPVLVSPANGATGLSLTPTLHWDAVAGAASYAIYIGTTANPALIGTTTGTSVRISGFRSGTVYYWKIVARNSSTSSASSDVWSFKTR